MEVVGKATAGLVQLVGNVGADAGVDGCVGQVAVWTALLFGVLPANHSSMVSPSSCSSPHFPEPRHYVRFCSKRPLRHLACPTKGVFHCLRMFRDDRK